MIGNSLRSQGASYALNNFVTNVSFLPSASPILFSSIILNILSDTSWNCTYKLLQETFWCYLRSWLYEEIYPTLAGQKVSR